MQATPLSEDETILQPKAFMTEQQIPQQRIAEALDRLSSWTLLSLSSSLRPEPLNPQPVAAQIMVEPMDDQAIEDYLGLSSKRKRAEGQLPHSRSLALGANRRDQRQV